MQKKWVNAMDGVWKRTAISSRFSAISKALFKFPMWSFGCNESKFTRSGLNSEIFLNFVSEMRERLRRMLKLVARLGANTSRFKFFHNKSKQQSADFSWNRANKSFKLDENFNIDQSIIPMSMDKCIERKSASPTGGKVVDANVRISCSFALTPQQKCILCVLSFTCRLLVLNYFFAEMSNFFYF